MMELPSGLGVICLRLKISRWAVNWDRVSQPPGG